MKLTFSVLEMVVDSAYVRLSASCISNCSEVNCTDHDG